MGLRIGAACSLAIVLLSTPAIGESPGQTQDPCPVRFGPGLPSIDVEDPNLNLTGLDGLSELEVLAPSESGLFLARSHGPDNGPLVLEIQTTEGRPSRKVPVRSLAGAISLSPAVSEGDHAAGLVAAGQYRVVLWYKSPQAPSAGRLQRLCMAVSGSFVTSKDLWVHRFE